MDQSTTVAEQLVTAGVLTAVGSGDDFALTDDFRDDWRRRTGNLRDRNRTAYLAQFFEIDPDALSIETTPDGAVLVRKNRQRIGEWPSKVAIDADVAAFVTLQEWLPEWEELDGRTRDELVARLRLFLSSCPDCDGDLTVEESAATPKGVPRLRCPACDAIVS